MAASPLGQKNKSVMVPLFNDVVATRTAAEGRQQVEERLTEDPRE